MTRARLAACSLMLLLVAPRRDGAAQSAPEVQVTGGISTAAFRTPQGNIRVHVSADAAPGDTISGVVLAEPAGATAQEQQDNSGLLSGFVVELEGQRTPVSDRQYQWTVPVTLRNGRAVLTLRGRDGQVLSQAQVPVDPQPALPRPAGADEGFTLPVDGQVGRPAIVRGSMDGTLRGKAVDIGDSAAELLAVSPRQLVFRVPQTTGSTAIRVTDGARTATGTIRAIGVRLTASSTNLLRGQRATLTTAVNGLAGITEPVTLSFRNLSPGVVQIEGGEPRVTIEPRDVRAGGTFADTRRLTGVQAGPFQIVASVTRPALSQFDVTRTINAVVDTWEVRARFRIGTETRTLIQRSILDARRPLDDFLRRQEMMGGDPQAVFQALLGHYCYDLRDNQLRSANVASAPTLRQPIMLRAAGQTQAPTDVAPAAVRRWTFSQFLSDLVARASSQQVGYLFVSSSPERAGITIDGQRKSELTNRRFVTSVGTHDVQVARQSKPCRVNVTINPLETSVVNCE